MDREKAKRRKTDFHLIPAIPGLLKNKNGPEGSRTPDLRYAEPTLSQLSYRPMSYKSCPWQDSNLRTRLRRPVLYPLSYRGDVYIFNKSRAFSRAILRWLILCFTPAPNWAKVLS